MLHCLAAAILWGSQPNTNNFHFQLCTLHVEHVLFKKNWTHAFEPPTTAHVGQLVIMKKEFVTVPMASPWCLGAKPHLPPYCCCWTKPPFVSIERPKTRMSRRTSWRSLTWSWSAEAMKSWKMAWHILQIGQWWHMAGYDWRLAGGQSRQRDRNGFRLPRMVGTDLSGWNKRNQYASTGPEESDPNEPTPHYSNAPPGKWQIGWTYTWKCDRQSIVYSLF